MLLPSSPTPTTGQAHHLAPSSPTKLVSASSRRTDQLGLWRNANHSSSHFTSDTPGQVTPHRNPQTPSDELPSFNGSSILQSLPLPSNKYHRRFSPSDRPPTPIPIRHSTPLSLHYTIRPNTDSQHSSLQFRHSHRPSKPSPLPTYKTRLPPIPPKRKHPNPKHKFIDPWGFATLNHLVKGAPQVFNSAPCHVQFTTQSRDTSPIRFSTTPPATTPISTRPDAVSPVPVPVPPPVRAGKAWRGARVMAAMTAGTRLQDEEDEEDEDDEEEDEEEDRNDAGSRQKRRSKRTPQISDAAQRARDARIRHYADLERYELAVETVWMSD